MIGFEMKAWGSNGFKQRRAAWTEGSLMSLKVLLSIGSLANRDSQGLVQRGAVSNIEASFKKIADNKFRHICSCGLHFALFLTGDIKFKYYFDSKKNSSQIQSELLHLFASKTKKIGDQVMIYFCSIVDDFVLSNFNNTDDDLVLTMPIRLTQVDTLGYDPAYVRLPSDSVGVSASLP